MPVFRQKLWTPESERIRQEEADRPKVTCTEQQSFTRSECPECNNKIIVHCPACNQKVTGCGCTLKDRVNSVKDELIERLFS